MAKVKTLGYLGLLQLGPPRQIGKTCHFEFSQLVGNSDGSVPPFRQNWLTPPVTAAAGLNPTASRSLTSAFSPNSEVALGSAPAPAPGAVFRALAENTVRT